MKNKINSRIKKVLLSVLGLLGINGPLICDEMIAMYGMPPNRVYGSGVVYGDIDGDGKNEVLEGIHYSYRVGNRDYSRVTNKEGKFVIRGYDFEEFVTIQFEDVDGEKNGSFESKKVIMDMFSNENPTLDIVLKKIESN